MAQEPFPTLAQIRAQHEVLGERINITPVLQWRAPGQEALLGKLAKLTAEEKRRGSSSLPGVPVAEKGGVAVLASITQRRQAR